MKANQTPRNHENYKDQKRELRFPMSPLEELLDQLPGPSSMKENNSSKDPSKKQLNIEDSMPHSSPLAR